MRVTGNMVNYFFVCKRKLWLFQHQIGFEQTSERVQLGDCKIVCVRMNDSLN